MKLKKVVLYLVLGTVVHPCALAQSLPVDWLTPTAPANNQFFLLDDKDSILAEVTLEALVGFPLEVGTASRLSSEKWNDRSLIPSNNDGDQTVEGFRVRVAPLGGIPIWSLTLDLSEPGDWWLAVGSLYRNDTLSHGPLQIQVNEGIGARGLDYLGSQGWNGGAGNLGGALDWDDLSQQLSPRSGNSGESGVAFFRLNSFGGPDSKITLQMPSGFAGGAAGDDVFFALGHSVPVIPEPGSGILCFLALLVVCRRRRTCQGF